MDFDRNFQEMLIVLIFGGGEGGSVSPCGSRNILNDLLSLQDKAIFCISVYTSINHDITGQKWCP